MSQQGGRPTGQEDDWWGQLYDDSAADTGPAAGADSLDDRFASASGTVGGPPRGVPLPTQDTAPDDWWRHTPEDTPPGPAAGAAWDSGPGESREPSQPPVPPVAPAAGAAWDSRPTKPDRSPSPPPTPPPPKPPAVGAAGGSGRAPVDGAAQVAPGGGEADNAPRDAETQAASAGADEVQAALGSGEAEPVWADAVAEAVPGSWEAQDTPDGGEAEAARAAEDAEAAGDSGAPQAGSGGAGSREREAVRASEAPQAGAGVVRAHGVSGARGADVRVGYVGSRPPTYAAEPTALPAADPDGLDVAVPDTVLDGAAYGACTLRAVSIRGDSARYRGEPRRDALLTARFGEGDRALVLIAMATGARATPGAHRAAAEACQWIAEAVGRSHARLAEDIRTARRGELKSGLHRLTDRSLGRLRADAAEQGVDPEQYTAGLRCLLLPADPACRVRVFFGVGAGGLFRLREGEWQDIEPGVAETSGHPVVGFGSRPSETPDGDRLTMDLGIPTPPNPYEPAPAQPRDPFRFRASLAQPGDTLLMCTAGLADPLRGEPEARAHLARRWSDPVPPGLAPFLADAQVRVKGYADDRTAAAVWEA
ncbi:protein phosphatase 2C domain-containing protein [Streptomyces cyslabdanicus]|uniref:protein phosphatase 2C domain-containing protein n=1 Tax=Streptomyces cyslabdanicus TaxID=1470456 RepID=UPI004044B2EA